MAYSRRLGELATSDSELKWEPWRYPFIHMIQLAQLPWPYKSIYLKRNIYFYFLEMEQDIWLCKMKKMRCMKVQWNMICEMKEHELKCSKSAPKCDKWNEWKVKRSIYMNENEHKAIAHKCLYEIRKMYINVNISRRDI